MADGKKRVLIVDDSVFARKIVSDIVRSCPDLEIAGTATNGLEAVRMAGELRPDVITMDVEMPQLDGLEALRQLMETNPTPVVMLSSLTVSGARVSIEALRLGAVDVIAKPHGTHSIGLTSSRDEVVAKILAAASVDLDRLKNSPTPKARSLITATTCPRGAFPVVIIASSTGGPKAVRSVIPDLVDSRAAYVIVQHLPEGFSAFLAQDLNNATEFGMREAAHGDSLKPGEVLLAKSGSHCVFNRKGEIELNTGPTLWGVRPAADITMASAVPVFQSRLIGVILTGMGRDGADGIKLIKEAGGITIAEHESTCVVYGMPRVAIESGAVDVIAPLNRIAEAINASVAQVAEGRVKGRAA